MKGDIIPKEKQKEIERYSKHPNLQDTYISTMEVKNLLGSSEQPFMDQLVRSVKYDDQIYDGKAVPEEQEVGAPKTPGRPGPRSAPTTPVRRDSRGRPLAPARVEKAYREMQATPSPSNPQWSGAYGLRTPSPKGHERRVNADSPDYFLSSPPLAHSTPAKGIRGFAWSPTGRPTQGNTHEDSFLSPLGAIRESPEWALTSTAGQSVLVAQDGSYALTDEDIRALISARDERNQLRRKVSELQEEIEKQVASAIDISLSYFEEERAQKSELSAEEKDNLRRQVSEANDKVRRLEKKLERMEWELEKVNNYAKEMKITCDDAQKGRKYVQESNLKLRAEARDAVDRYTRLKANQMKLEDKLKRVEYDEGVKDQKLKFAKVEIEMLEEELVKIQELKATIDEQVREIEDLKAKNDQLNVEQSLLETSYVGAGRSQRKDTSGDSGKKKKKGDTAYLEPVGDLANMLDELDVVVGESYKEEDDSRSWQAQEDPEEGGDSSQGSRMQREKEEQILARKMYKGVKDGRLKVIPGDRDIIVGKKIAEIEEQLAEMVAMLAEKEEELKAHMGAQEQPVASENEEQIKALKATQVQIQQERAAVAKLQGKVKELQSQLATQSEETTKRRTELEAEPATIQGKTQGEQGDTLMKLKREWAAEKAEITKELEDAKGKIAELTESGSKQKDWFGGEIADREKVIEGLKGDVHSSREKVKELSAVIQQLEGDMEGQKEEAGQEGGKAKNEREELEGKLMAMEKVKERVAVESAKRLKEAEVEQLEKEYAELVKSSNEEKIHLRRDFDEEMEGLEREWGREMDRLITKNVELLGERKLTLDALGASQTRVKELELAVEKLQGKQGVVAAEQLRVKDQEISDLKKDLTEYSVKLADTEQKLKDQREYIDSGIKAWDKQTKELADTNQELEKLKKEEADKLEVIAQLTIKQGNLELKEKENMALIRQVTGMNQRVAGLRANVRQLQNLVAGQQGIITGHLNTNTQLRDTVAQLRNTITGLQNTITQQAETLLLVRGDVPRPRRKLDLKGVQREAIVRALKDLTPEELERLDPKLWPATPYENVTVFQFMFWPILELIRFTIWHVPFLLRWWERKAKEAGMEDWEIYEPEWEIAGRPVVQQGGVWIRGGATPSFPGTPVEEMVSDGGPMGFEVPGLPAPSGSPRPRLQLRGGSGQPPHPEPISIEEQHLLPRYTQAELDESFTHQQQSHSTDPERQPGETSQWPSIQNTGSPPSADYFTPLETPKRHPDSVYDNISPHKKCSSPNAWLRAVLWTFMFLLILGSLLQQWAIVAQTEEIKQQWAKPNMVVVRDWLADRRPRAAGWCEDDVCYYEEWWWVRMVREWIIEWLGLDKELY